MSKCYWCVSLYPEQPEKQLDALEGKYFCCREHKVAFVKKNYGSASPVRVRRLTVPEMRAELKKWSKRKRPLTEEEIFGVEDKQNK